MKLLLALIERLRLEATTIPALYVIASTAYFLRPSIATRTIVGQNYGLATVIWNTMWCVGGLATIAGKVHGRPALKNFGLTLLAGGWAMTFAAACVSPGAFDLRALSYLLLIVWAMDRSHRLHGEARS